MSTGIEQTFHLTKEDVRKLESRESKIQGGKVPADSEVSIMKVILLSKPDSRVRILLAPLEHPRVTSFSSQSTVDSNSNPDTIAERQASLPLPEQPPMPSDWNSADQRTVNVGSGRLADDVSYGNGQSGLRSPATGDSAVRVSGQTWKEATAPDERVGREGKEGLEGPPKDARRKT
ncbi:hypothetical protein GP486_001586 [Trichoglossum hirsutum]|uniref:Uncharacterized protein n=1 Tax=Trichoglossum hirsutum TaxID=265104 RepID=A0A9P8LGK5_9PEZI|nr:hypothetical protein GP486_001586 [Trichoglossum hirsutum]